MNVETIINETLYEILRKHGITMDMITPEKSIVDDLKAESLDVIEMMLALEENFNISVEEEDVYQLRSIGEVYTFVRNRLEAEKVA